jgi:O-acetyl-ADP-ribose deacetylase (regulator of RNase III)
LIHYKTGDVTKATEQVIAHGVNCTGHFGSGVAGAIKRDHPYVRNQYLSLQEHILGTCQFVDYAGQIWVNAHTQQDKGYDGRQYADLNAIANCLVEIDYYMQEHELHSIAMPKIGCGLGGLRWDDVMILVDGILEDYEVFIYEL